MSQSSLGLGELWQVQESLLQSYRLVFMTVEAILFAVATYTFAATNIAIRLRAPIILLGLALIPIWMTVCSARARAVTFIHWLIQRYESGEQIAQRRMDREVPLLFGIMWLCLAVAAVW